jgi:hypothetical protein
VRVCASSEEFRTTVLVLRLMERQITETTLDTKLKIEGIYDILREHVEKSPGSMDAGLLPGHHAPQQNGEGTRGGKRKNRRGRGSSRGSSRSSLESREPQDKASPSSTAGSGVASKEKQQPANGASRRAGGGWGGPKKSDAGDQGGRTRVMGRGGVYGDGEEETQGRQQHVSETDKTQNCTAYQSPERRLVADAVAEAKIAASSAVLDAAGDARGSGNDASASKQSVKRRPHSTRKSQEPEVADHGLGVSLNAIYETKYMYALSCL